MTKILLIQGPNMSYLGRRQPEIYGKTSAAELDAMLLEHAKANNYELTIFYTHSESKAIERLYDAIDEGIQGLVMNPAAFLFAGYALRDCLRAIPYPYRSAGQPSTDSTMFDEVVWCSARPLMSWSPGNSANAYWS